MAGKVKRLSKVARELNVGIATLVEFLKTKDIEVDPNPNTKLEAEHYAILSEEFADDQSLKEEAEKTALKREKRKTVSLKTKVEENTAEEESDEEEVVTKSEPAPQPVVEEKPQPEETPKEVEQPRSEEHTSELQSRPHLVCRLLLEKKKKNKKDKQ